MKSVYAEGKKSVKQQEQPGDWCDVCGEGILNGDDLQATEPAWLAFRGEVDREEGKAYRRRGFSRNP